MGATLASGVEGEFIADGRYVGFLYAVIADLEYQANGLIIEHVNVVRFCWGVVQSKVMGH